MAWKRRTAFYLTLLLCSHSALAMGKLAIIIDDLGYDPLPRQIAHLPKEIAVSVIPFTPYDTAVALSAYSQGREVMLHLPMEATPGSPQEPMALMLSMTPRQITDRIQEALYRVPHVIAANNHMGSVFTENWGAMVTVLRFLKSKGLTFIDSRTSPDSRGLNVASELGMPILRRNIFLDHQQDEAFFLSQLEKAIKRAERDGKCIAIAHPHPLSLTLLTEKLPDITRRVELVPISTLINGQK
ncbi:divergent polysaccharide deacetylase family protein [Parasalinivibrio latis]|uniref:divergent polysaccharide deacetylase family protein n=1 Tax=Parasalinivibrio latis TaxID=2952610 RepID=UPI0030E5151D